MKSILETAFFPSRRDFSLLILLCFSFLFIGCCCSPFNQGRRSQVLTTWDPCIIDYNFDCPPCDEEEDCCLEEYNPLEDPKRPVHDGHYRFALGDVFEISILGEEDSYTENAVVAPDGKIYYAFLDGVPALGRTVDEVTKEMEENIKHLFLRPIITISPQIATTEAYKILGRIAQPGIYPVNRELNLREAIAIAGGLLTEHKQDDDEDSDIYPLANLKESYIVRDGKKLDVNFESLIYNPNSQQEVIVKAGDFIYIAPFDTRDVYLLGAIASPNRVTWYRGLTLFGALTYGGGWRYGTPWGADLHNVLIVRGSLDCPCAMQVDISLILSGEARDICLQPGDIIYVHNKTLRFGRYLVNLAITSFVESFAVAAGSHYTAVHWFPIHGGTSTTDNVNE